MSRTQPDEPIETTRIRDMPAPRLAEGVAARPMRWAFTWPYRIILLGVYRAGFRPWHLTVLGLVTGYFRGVVDDAIMRVVDAFLAIPVVVIGLLALTALGPSRVTVILVIGIVFTPIIARTVRAAVLSERELEYVEAARLRNEHTPYVLFGEILPNVLGPVLVEFTVRLGYAIFAIATLSFLGFGIQPPAPDWGLQIFENYGLLSAGDWWPTLFPALAIATLVVGVNLIADGLTQAFER